MIDVTTHFVIEDATIKDSRLSFGARGLLCSLMSGTRKPGETIEEIASQSPDSEADWRGYLEELKSAGYLARTKSGTPIIGGSPDVVSEMIGGEE